MSLRKKGNNTQNDREASQDWEELSFDGGEFEDEASSFAVNTAAFGNIKALAKAGRVRDAGVEADAYVPEEPAQADAYVPEEPAQADAYVPEEPAQADAYVPEEPAQADGYGPEELPVEEDDYDYTFDEEEYEYESEEELPQENEYGAKEALTGGVYDYAEEPLQEYEYEPEEAAYEEPAYEEPAYEEPVYEEPVYEEPIYEESAENDFGDGLRIMDLNRQSGAEEEDDDDEPSFFERMGNKILIGASVAVLLIFAVAAFFILRGQSSEPAQTFASVSSGLENVDLIGGEALTALMADKETEYLASLSGNTGTSTGTVSKYEETDTETETITVKLVMTSVEKDLKIKFTNSSTGKLIANIPFEVKVMDSSGSVYTWTDEDKDGIIYMSGLTAGTYRVALLKLDDELYANYVLSDSGTVKVQDTIVYAQVDVSAEIKEESEIDVSTEEAQVEIEVESVNTDTVEWVESTKTYVGEAYTLIDKLLISVPTASRVTGTFLATAITNNTDSLTLTVGETGSISASSDVDGADLTYESGDENVATVSEDGIVTAVAAGSTLITVTETVKNEDGSTTETTESCTVTVSAKTTESSSTESSTTGSGSTESSTTGSSSTESTTGSSSTGSSTTGSGTTYSAFTLSLSETELSLNKNTSGTVTVTPQDNTSGESITYTCTSSDTSVAEVYMSDNTVTVKGIAAGTATITVSACYTNSTSLTASASFTVTVVSSATALKTTDGRAVYVLEDGSYRIATYDDYYTDGMAYYVKTEGYTYTGWQTIDGNTYYYTAAGNYVVGDQVILGVQYTFSSTGVLQAGSGELGIDVSSHNGSIDWEAVKNAGISYVIIRCGYRGYGTGVLVEDSFFVSNIQGALNAGLQVGVYFFSQAVTTTEAVEEASMVLQLISGYSVSLPVYIDVEFSNSAHDGRADSLSVSERTAIVNAFCQTIQNSGYTAGIYANSTWLTSYLDMSQLSSYRVWLAQYAATPTYTGTYHMWQYTSSGSISGVSGNVDLNLWYY